MNHKLFRATFELRDLFKKILWHITLPVLAIDFLLNLEGLTKSTTVFFSLYILLVFNLILILITEFANKMISKYLNKKQKEYVDNTKWLIH